MFEDYIKTGYRSRTNSACGLIETDFVLLQSSPIGPNNTHWQPISISIGGNSESLSDHSSRCSSQPPSPRNNTNQIISMSILSVLIRLFFCFFACSSRPAAIN